MAQGSAPLTGVKVLVVDDQPSEVAAFSAWLRKAGCEVDTARSGEEALARVGAGVDIVIADLLMPGGMDGTELTRRIRLLGSADVLILTGSPDLRGAMRALREGASDYLVKPPTEETLLAAVNRCAGRRRSSASAVAEKAAEVQKAKPSAEAEAVAEVAKLREMFSNFATPEVAQFILKHPQDFWRQEEVRTLSVLFADVRGFTPFARVVTPKEAVASLNEVLSRAIDAVHSEKGIVNKFMGDGLMAVFGAPVPLEDHAGAAARAALRMRRYIDDLVRARRGMGKVPLRVGMGVNSGEVLVACLGSRARVEYGVIGHPVNLASRLEHIATAGTILLGPETAKLIKGRFEMKDRGSIELPGMLEPTSVSELICEL